MTNGAFTIVGQIQEPLSLGMDGCLSSRVADARSIERPLHSTSQPANVAQRNRVPEETDARTVITSFDIVMGTAKVEEHGSAARSNGSPAAKVRIIF